MDTTCVDHSLIFVPQGLDKMPQWLPWDVLPLLDNHLMKILSVVDAVVAVAVSTCPRHVQLVTEKGNGCSCWPDALPAGNKLLAHHLRVLTVG